MGAKFFFNFAPKFSQKWGFLRTKFCIFGQFLDDIKNFHKCSDSPKFMGGQLLPVPVTMPLCPWVILVVAVAFRHGLRLRGFSRWFSIKSSVFSER